MLFCPRYPSEAAWFLLPQDQHGSHCLKIIVGLVASCSLGCRLGSTRGRFLFGHAFPTTTSSRTILLPRSVSAWRDTLCLGAETAKRHSYLLAHLHELAIISWIHSLDLIICFSQLLLRMHTDFFQAGCTVVDRQQPADRMCIIVTGRSVRTCQGFGARTFANSLNNRLPTQANGGAYLYATTQYRPQYSDVHSY